MSPPQRPHYVTLCHQRHTRTDFLPLPPLLQPQRHHSTGLTPLGAAAAVPLSRRGSTANLLYLQHHLRGGGSSSSGGGGSSGGVQRGGGGGEGARGGSEEGEGAGGSGSSSPVPFGSQRSIRRNSTATDLLLRHFSPTNRPSSPVSPVGSSSPPSVSAMMAAAPVGVPERSYSSFTAMGMMGGRQKSHSPVRRVATAAELLPGKVSSPQCM